MVFLSLNQAVVAETEAKNRTIELLSNFLWDYLKVRLCPKSGLR